MEKKSNNIQTTFLKISALIYIISLNFHQYQIFEISKKIEFKITEFFFILFTIIFIINLKNLKINNFKLYDYIILLFPFISLVHLIYFQDKDSIVGFFAAAYLFLIYIFFKTLFLNGYKKIILNYLILSGIISSFFAILGWMLIQFNINTSLVLVYDYPIKIGQSGRSSAFFETPNSLMLFLIVPLFLSLDKFFQKKKLKNLFSFIFIFLASVLTFSKSFLIIFGLIICYFSFKKNILKNFSFLFLIILTLIYLLISNFLILEKSSNLYKQLYNKTYVNTDRNLFFENKNYVITATNYYENKIKATELILDSFFIGNGFNSFANYKNYEYPHLVGRPHSTYFGIFAEYGLLGIVFLILLFYLSLKKSLHFNKSNLSLVMICIFLIIDGVNTDLLFTKIFWIFFAFISYNRIRSMM
ncbi:O-antigen ligase family protein [Candidatus Pelagibacter sp.]|nr:O-antigen ligase family protein [Candidatus Pelagibacter sp.]